MADRDTANTPADRRGAISGASAVAWSALIVGILALAFAWTAFTRTGDLDNRIRQQVQESVQGVQQGNQEQQDTTETVPDTTNPDGTDAAPDSGTTPEGSGADGTDTTTPPQTETAQ